MITGSEYLPVEEVDKVLEVGGPEGAHLVGLAHRPCLQNLPHHQDNETVTTLADLNIFFGGFLDSCKCSITHCILLNTQ